ncbi:MAG TPA: ATPase, T2SS/T4P/T4SS family [Armatimonadota bacterium]|nr:ATPase, T2SS/T4P/T4SS family [Armatimonadota bacterium]
MVEKRAIGQIIREITNLSEQDLNNALQVQRGTKEPLGQLLLKMGLITERDRARALGRQWRVPFVELNAEQLDEEVLESIPKHLIQRYRVLPIARQGNRLTVAMINPLDIFTIDQLRLVTGLEIDPVITVEEDLNNAITNFLSSGDHMVETIRRVVDEVSGEGELKVIEGKDDDDISIDQLRELVDDAPIIQLVNMIIRQALSDKASDIHIQPEVTKVRVRYRIDGLLQDSTTVPKQVQAALISRIKVMADMDIAEKRAPQDGRISLTMNGREYDMRVSTLPGGQGEKVVMRVLDKSGISVALNKLGIPTAMLDEYDRLIHRSYGILLVTGPTGSGKSTTLYATLNQLNSTEKNILTVEDPIEYQLPGLTQTAVNTRAGMTFPAVLRTMLRQDPDIILVGETRDGETALISVEAALTGHLVLSSLHTNDAPGAIARLTEMGIEPFLTASSVIGVLAQRLVRCICPRCKESYTPSMEAFRRLNFPMDSEKVTFYRGAGCQYCRGTGYKGRIGVFELMTVDNEIRELILQKAPTHVLRQAALDMGMISLRQDAMNKILEGITSMEEALRVIYAE